MTALEEQRAAWKESRLQLEAEDGPYQLKTYGGSKLPPGAIRVRRGWLENGRRDRNEAMTVAVLARAGVPIIGRVCPSSGGVDQDNSIIDTRLERLPFRFQWASWSFALATQHGIAVMQEASPSNIRNGHYAAVACEKDGDYWSIAGRVVEVDAWGWGLDIGDGQVIRAERDDVRRGWRAVGLWDSSRN